jgi:chemotaxis protein histidine kinase CheA/CheY-like chemotaxis protein
MIEFEPRDSLDFEPLADRLAALAEHWNKALVEPEKPGQAWSLREELLDLRTSVVGLAPAKLSRVLGRLAVLTEVWECLLADDPVAADGVGLFCAKALAQLGRDQRGGAGTDVIPELILEQSASSWGEYLALLEPSEPEAESLDPAWDDLQVEPEAPTFDAQALLRFFRGPAPGSALDIDNEVMADTSNEEPPAGPTSRETLRVPEPVARPVPIAAAPVRVSAGELVIRTLPQLIDLDEEIRGAFLADSSELFERIETLVLGLSRSASLADDLGELRRGFHTLKGAAGSVGLADLAAMVHDLEERLEGAGAIVSPGLENALLGVLGYLEGILGLLRRKPGGSTAKDATSETPALPGTAASSPFPSSLVTTDRPALTTEPPASDDGPVRVPASRFDDLMDMVSELIVRRRLWTAHAEGLKAITAMVRSCRGRMLSSLDRLHESGLSREDRARLLNPRTDLPGQLRRLGELADDLSVLAESSRAAAQPLADHGDAMGRLAIQLWDELQSIRILPVRGLFQRLARVAHEAARVEGRQIDVVMFGEETGVDRAVQDKAFEPLLHLVRNAVGHGIEAPQERSAAGKNHAGKISLEARREGNSLVLVVADDGRGLDLHGIEAKARRVGLLAADERPGPERLKSLIFHPGFSTRSEANSISGRGVGMDVVAREVGLLKGTIELATEPNRGTRLTVRLPARLALETAMIVRVDGQAFAVPVAQIEHAQSVAWAGPTTPNGTTHEDVTNGRLRFQDQVIPVLQAREILGIADTRQATWPKLLVVRHSGGLVGLVVDAIEGTEDLVIKSLGTLLAGHPLISGTSLSISGEVISILDPSRLYHWIQSEAPPLSTGSLPTGRQARPHGTPAVLVVDDSISVRRVLARGLQAMRLDVDEVSDGLEALGRLRGRAYDMVVTDLEMPRLDGFELVAEMQRVPSLAGIPVMVASTRVDEETQRRVLKLGAKLFLAKPVDQPSLASAVSTLLTQAADGKRTT